MSQTVLVVDDEDSILQLVDYNLRQAGFAVALAADGTEALAQFAAASPDLIILDVMLPDMDGFDVCRRIRQTSAVPVLFLTARDDERDKITGLEVGDDYLTKPFSPAELVARVRAILRRSAPEADGSRERIIEAGIVRVDLEGREVFSDGKPLSLTPTEFDLLTALVRHPGVALSRDTLLDLVWGSNYFGDHRVVDVHIKNLRDKLEPGTDGAPVIETVRSVGYRLRA